MESYLSIVVTSLNDNNLDGVQNFMTATLDQCRSYKIFSELVIVAWSHSEERVWLPTPKHRGPTSVRLIELPEAASSLHSEAIAQNVGIRHARGRFILTADANRLLPDDLMQFIGWKYRRFSSLESDDIAVQDGSIGLGKGWFRREIDRSKPFRWFNNDAEILIQPNSDRARVLALDIEPGPGVDKGPTTLDVLDDDGAKVLSVRLTKRRVVNVPVPNSHRMSIRLRLHVSNTGHTRVSDHRPLNARVMGCGLYQSPVLPVTWTLAQRIGWALTRSAGDSLLPKVEPVEDWADSQNRMAGGHFKIHPRTRWLDLAGGANREDWGLGAEKLKETLLVKGAEPPLRRSKTKGGVNLLALPFVWLYRSIPRPALPEPEAFAQTIAAAEPVVPLDNPPKISIVTPSYQQGHYLEWTIRSVLEQGYPNLEYVVMDGGSTDETGEILARYRDRLSYCESAPDDGQADAVARGFEHTSGEIMAYLNSDDVLAPGALNFAARFLTAHPEVDAIYSHRVFIDEENRVIRYWILPPHRNWMMERWDYIPQETCFWRRRIYEKVGGIDRSFQFALDYDLFVRFMRQGRLERVNRFLGAFREHSSSKTTLQDGPHPEVERVCETHGIRIGNWHTIPQLAQYELLDVRSRKFAARGKVLPGALAGIGYDYDLVWGGRLSDPRNSSRSKSGTRPI